MGKPYRQARDLSVASPNCFTCQWRERTEWCVLLDDDVRMLNERKTTCTYQPGQFIFNQGDSCTGVYCIVSGSIAIRKADSHGNTVLVRMRHGGETIGYRDFFASKMFTTSAEALVPCQVCFIARSSVRALLERNPALGLAFFRQVAGDLVRTEDSLLQSATLTTRTRLAHLLLTLKDRYATVIEDGSLMLKLPLSRQDIADMLGTRPETVARIIHGLEKDGVARFSGRTVVIPDLDSLLDEVEPDDAF